MVVYGDERESYQKKEIERSYHSEMVFKHAYIIGLCKGYSDVLESGDLTNILIASKTLIDAFGEVKTELGMMNVPEGMRESYQVFMKSIETYRQATQYVHSAVGILLGYENGTDEEVSQLLDKGEDTLIMANKYFGLSLASHGEQFKLGNEDTHQKEVFSGDPSNKKQMEDEKIEKGKKGS